MWSVSKRRWGYLSLAEMFAVWALVVAWLQLTAGEMTAHETATEPLPQAAEIPTELPTEKAAAPDAQETQIAQMAVQSGETVQAQDAALPVAGTSGMLTETALSLAIAVETDAPVAPDALPRAADQPIIQQIAAAPATAEPASAPAEEPPFEEEPFTPPEDSWVWETDETGNILARIDSPQVLVRVGEAPVNIWGGLSVQDPDSPESFRPFQEVQGQWGALTLYEDGSWNYVEREDHAPLVVGVSAETFTVQSFDGTSAQVVIWLQYDQIGNLLAA